MPHQTLKKINIDIHQCRFSKDGVEDFWWPFHNEELRTFANDSMRLYTDVIQSFDTDDSLALHPYRIFAKYFICELVGLFQADALFSRAEKNNITLEIPKNTRFWSAVQKGETPNENDILDILRKGPVKISIIRKLLNVRRILKILSSFKTAKSGIGLSLNNLKISPLTPNILQKKIVATERCSLISRHAKTSKTDVYFQRSNKWFSSVTSKEEEISLVKNNTAFETRILDDVAKLYKKYGEELPLQSRKHYASLLSKGTTIIQVHLERLINSPEKLPRHLWTGTGGQIWDTTLRLAVQYCGGKVCGHDHATGSGHCARFATYFIEFWGCDDFLTFNKAKTEGLKNNQKNMAFLEKNIPAISYLPLKHAQKPIKHFDKKKSSIKKIILMSPPYDRDRGRLSPIMPDMVRLNWQCRLIKFLKQEGYEVILKAHPESKILPPKSFTSIVGAAISIEAFESMMEEGDLIIFDHIFTSTFRAAFETNIPLVIIEAVDFELIQDAKKLVTERAGFITASCDNKNRLQVNWEELSRAIKKAFAKNENHEFAKTYLAE